MFPEFFAEFIIDSDCDADSHLRPKYTDPYAYVPLDRSPRWFLDANLDNSNNDNREIIQNRAAFAYLQGDFITAMDIYFSLLKNETKNRRNSNFALIDSVIRCGLKIAPINGPQLYFLLQKLNVLVSTCDEQLQYWVESLEMETDVQFVYYEKKKNCYSVFSSWNQYQRLFTKCNFIMCLCRLARILDFNFKKCSSTVFTLYFCSLHQNYRISLANQKRCWDFCTNLRIGSLCRAICILENLLPSKTKCFDSCNLKLMKAKLRDLCNEEKLSEVKAAVCADLIRGEKVKTIEVNYPSFCKGVLKNKKAEDTVIFEFIHRFNWLFNDVNQQLVSDMLQIS
uniref:Tetratricopeptide repeat protein 27 n=1 Tax=Elaeophora elaphi TaxID=1147741 RepID=A0A0R3S0U4_9BILA